MGYAYRLPTYLANNQVWVDLAATLDTVLGNYVDIPVQKLSYIRDVNDFHPSALAAKIGVALLDESDAYYQGVRWNDPNVRLMLASMLGMDYAGLSNLQTIVHNAFIKHSVQFFPEQGTPSWPQYLGFTSDLVVQAEQLWSTQVGNEYGPFLVEGDPGIGTPVWEGGTWFPTSHYNVTIFTDFNSTVSIEDFSVLLKFAAPINIVFNQISIGTVYFTGNIYVSMSSEMTIYDGIAEGLQKPVWTISGKLPFTTSFNGGCGDLNALSFGGTVSNTPIGTTAKFTSGVWTTFPNMVTARHSMGSAGGASGALAIGGNSGSTSLTSTEQFNSSVWVTGSNLVVAREAVGGAGVFASALAIGGVTSGTTPLASTETYNGTTWSMSANLNTGRYYNAASGTGNTSAMTAAGSGATELISSEIFNGTAWTTGAYNLSTVRVAGAMISSIITGGSNNSATVFSSSEVYNSTNQIWSYYGRNLNYARYGFGGGGVNPTIFGGLSSLGTTMQSTEVLVMENS